jgi:GT2 family glycosyltransferase
MHATSPAPTITSVIVCYDEDAEQIRAGIDSLLGQTRPPSEILVVDNSPDGSIAERIRGHAPQVTAIAAGHNLGYLSAVNLAARRATGDYLLCMNPDAHAAGDCLERLAEVMDGDDAIAIVGAQILLADGATRNAGPNPLHPTGISPSGGYGKPRESGQPRDVIVTSGACFLLRREAFVRLGGFVEGLFLYYEDVDIGWRARIAGYRVIYCPAATVAHDYDFGGRAQKWFWLERSRIFCVLSNYELRTLFLLTPLLVATEAGLLVVAALGGWLPAKLRAYRGVFELRGRLRTHRRAVQALRTRRDAQLFALFDDRLDSALLPRAGTALANIACVPYMRLVRSIGG